MSSESLSHSSEEKKLKEIQDELTKLEHRVSYQEGYSSGYKDGRDMETETHSKLNICMDNGTAKELYEFISREFVSQRYGRVHDLIRILRNL